MICLTTTIGYFGKYIINLLINYILKEIKGTENYDKKIFFECIIVLYFSSIILSISLYSIFVCIFTKNIKKEAGDNVYRICQACEYIIYSEQKIIKKEAFCQCKCLQLCSNQLKIVVMKRAVLLLIIYVMMIVNVNVAAVVVVIIIQKIMIKIKNFFVIVIKHKGNLFGAIIF